MYKIFFILLSHYSRLVCVFFFLFRSMVKMDGGKSARMCLGNHVHTLLAYRERSAHLACASSILITPRYENNWELAESKAKRMVLPTCLFVLLFLCEQAAWIIFTKSASYYVILHSSHCQSTYSYSQGWIRPCLHVVQLSFVLSSCLQESPMMLDSHQMQSKTLKCTNVSSSAEV